MDALSRLSEMARQILQLARKEAAFFQHDQMRPEDILLALCAVPECGAFQLLRRRGIDPQLVVRETVNYLHTGKAVDIRSITLSAAARRCLDAAGREAQQMGAPHIDTEHLLLGLAAETEGVVPRVLSRLELDASAIRADIAALPLDRGRDQQTGEPAVRGRTSEHQPRSDASRGTPMSDRFDKFTERAKKVLVLAQEEAQRLSHNYIGTEHLLLGLIAEREGIAAKVLSNLGVELDQARSTVQFIIGRGDRMVIGDISLTPRARKVIELATEEARRLNHNYIGTEHILLGLVREGEGIAAGVLESLGVNLEKVRTQIITVVSQSGQAAASRPRTTAPPDGERQVFLPFRLDRRTAETLDRLVDAGVFSSRASAAELLLGAALEGSRATVERLAAARPRPQSGEERGLPGSRGPSILPPR